MPSEAGSENTRDWARQELHGYAGADTVPDYRHVPAALMLIFGEKPGGVEVSGCSG